MILVILVILVMFVGDDDVGDVGDGNVGDGDVGDAEHRPVEDSFFVLQTVVERLARDTSRFGQITHRSFSETVMREDAEHVFELSGVIHMRGEL